MSQISVFNSSSNVTPITGKALPGLEWCDVDGDDPAVLSLIHQGVLISPAKDEVQDPPEPQPKTTRKPPKTPGTAQANRRGAVICQEFA